MDGNLIGGIGVRSQEEPGERDANEGETSGEFPKEGQRDAWDGDPKGEEDCIASERRLPILSGGTGEVSGELSRRFSTVIICSANSSLF